MATGSAPVGKVMGKGAQVESYLRETLASRIMFIEYFVIAHRQWCHGNRDSKVSIF